MTARLCARVQSEETMARAVIRSRPESEADAEALPLLIELAAAGNAGGLREAIDERVLRLRARRRVIGRDAADFEVASRYAPYSNEEHVKQVSAAMVAEGITVLQAHLLTADEREHTRRLLKFFDPPRGAAVLDAGCGVGGVARYMQEFRADLSFVMLNISRAQLELCPPQFPRVEASIEDTGLPPGTFDAVMCNYALGHVRLDLAFAEAARVTRPGGLLLIYDICAEDSERLVVTMGYKAHRAVIETARRYGYDLDRACRLMNSVRSPVIAALGDAAYEEMFGATRPTMFRFTKTRGHGQ